MFNRRSLLAATGLGFVSTRSRGDSGRSPAARVGHITDSHITPDRDAPKGMAQLFDHMARECKPSLVLHTGDTVMSVDGKVTGAEAAPQIAVWRAAAARSPAPIKACLGNHDIWDGAGPTAEIPADKKGVGLMTGVLGMPAPWYSFDHAGWHIIALSSVATWPRIGELGGEQFAWLAADLKHTPRERPVLVLSHLPILSVTSSVYGDETRKGRDVVVPGGWQHFDCFQISELFRRHPNVRVCLSGHMHTQDRCEYRGVSYICGGAACGAWWEGAEYGFPPCYGNLALYPDGKFDYTFVDYGWPARQYKGKQLPG